jgi:hypothetical protein
VRAKRHQCIILIKLRQHLGDLGIDVRIGVILKRNDKWTIFEGVWYEQDPADSFQTTRAVLLIW